MRALLFVVWLAAFTSSPASAQARPDRWQITLENDSLLWDVRLASLDGDTVTYRQAGVIGVVPVGDIRELRLFQASELQMGSAGGAFGALSGSDDMVFDLGPMDFAERLRAVQQVFQRFPPN